MIDFKEFKLGTKRVLFVGVAHNPYREKIEEIRVLLNNFSPDIVLVEGGFENGEYRDEDDAISKGWEMGFVSFYARNKKIKLAGNDPKKKGCVDFVRGLYGSDLTFLYFVLRSLDSAILMNYEDASRKEKAKIVIGEFEALSRWKGYDYSRHHFESIFKKHLGRKFDLYEDDFDCFRAESEDVIFEDISKKLDIYRDSFMIQSILGCLSEHNKIFIVKGGSHLEKCGELLGKLLDG